jgi:hypothetical protein
MQCACNQTSQEGPGKHLQQQNITMLSTVLTKSQISDYIEKLITILGAGRRKHHRGFIIP